MRAALLLLAGCAVEPALRADAEAQVDVRAAVDMRAAEAGVDASQVDASAADAHVAPPFVLISPRGGGVVGGTLTIRWDSGCPDACGIHVALLDRTGAERVLSGGALDYLPFFFDTRAAPDGEAYRVRLTRIEIGGGATGAVESEPFAIDNTAPIVEPMDAAVFGGTIAWTTRDAHPDLISLFVGTATAAEGVEDRGRLEWASSVRGEHRIRYLARDAAGNRGEAVGAPTWFP